MMTLSEAIRLGSMATRQGHGGQSILSDEAPCALGAVRLASGITHRDVGEIYVALFDRFPILEQLVPSPTSTPLASVGHMMKVVTIIWALNDHSTWTREHIAEWVEIVEAKMSEATFVDSHVEN